MEIDVFHDTVCPWCRIGKRHLQIALESWAGEPVSVRYRTFFLNADIPPEGYPFREYMRAKVGGRVPLETMFDGPRRAGAAAGVTFAFEQIERAPNTLLSHRLIALTPEAQREAMIEAIYAAYFEEGRDVGDLATLVAIAGAQGLDPAATEARLRGDEAADDVLAEARWAQQAGITGVPFFIFNGRFALNGAQPPQTILAAMRQAAENSRA